MPTPLCYSTALARDGGAIRPTDATWFNVLCHTSLISLLAEDSAMCCLRVAQRQISLRHFEPALVKRCRQCALWIPARESYCSWMRSTTLVCRRTTHRLAQTCSTNSSNGESTMRRERHSREDCHSVKSTCSWQDSHFCLHQFPSSN